MIDLLEKFEADRQAREDWVRDEGIKKGIKKGVKEGIKKGVKEGIKQATIKSIKSMIKFNIPLKNIAEEYNMTIEEINELLNDSSH